MPLIINFPTFGLSYTTWYFNILNNKTAVILNVCDVPHRVIRLSALKLPAEADCVVTLDQVRVRLLPVGALPLLHYIIKPAIITLKWQILISEIQINRNMKLCTVHIFKYLWKKIKKKHFPSPPWSKICSQLCKLSQRQRWCEIIHFFLYLWL